MSGQGPGLLDHFWALALDSVQERVAAATRLVAHVQASQVAHEAQESPDSVQCSDLAYSLKRLVRGLSSSRDGARQGFSLALAQFLTKFDQAVVPTSQIHDLITQELKISSTIRGSELKDVLLARIFATAALARSQRLTHNGKPHSVAIALAQEMITIAAKKLYFPEPAFKAFTLIVDTCGAKAYKKHFQAMVAPLIAQDPATMGADHLSLLLHLRNEGLETGPLPKGWCKGSHSVLAPGNVALLGPALEASTTMYPNVHSVWDRLQAHALLCDASMDAPDDKKAKQKGKKAKKGKKSATTAVDGDVVMGEQGAGLAAVWEQHVEGRLLQSRALSHKYLAMMLFQRWLTVQGRAGISVATLLSPRLVRTLCNASIEPHRHLHAAAQQVWQSLAATLATRPNDALTALQLLLSHPLAHKVDVLLARAAKMARTAARGRSAAASVGQALRPLHELERALGAEQRVAHVAWLWQRFLHPEDAIAVHEEHVRRAALDDTRDAAATGHGGDGGNNDGGDDSSSSSDDDDSDSGHDERQDTGDVVVVSNKLLDEGDDDVAERSLERVREQALERLYQTWKSHWRSGVVTDEGLTLSVLQGMAFYGLCVPCKTNNEGNADAAGGAATKKKKKTKKKAHGKRRNEGTSEADTACPSWLHALCSREAPEPALSENEVSRCRGRANQMLTDLATAQALLPVNVSNMDEGGDADRSSSDEGSPAATARRRGPVGCSADGSPWARRALHVLCHLAAHCCLLKPLEADVSQALAQARTHEAALAALEHPSPEASAIRALMLQMGCQLVLASDDDVAEAVDVLAELGICLAKLGQRGVSHDDSDDDGDDADEPTPVEVLVDLMLSLLSRPSHLTRECVRQAFRDVAEHIGRRSVQTLLDVVAGKEPDDVASDDEVSLDVNLLGSSESDSDADDDGDEEDEDQSDVDLGEGLHLAGAKFTPEQMALLTAALGDDGNGGDGDNGAADGIMWPPNEEESDEGTPWASRSSIPLEDAPSEELARLDAAIAEHMRLAKARARAPMEAVYREVNFRLRVVDLLEIYAKKASNQDIILHIVQSLLTLIAEIHGDKKFTSLYQRVLGLVKNKICREVPSGVNATALNTHVVTTLNAMKRAPSAKYGADVLLPVLLWALRGLRQQKPSAAKLAKKARKKRKGKKAQNDDQNGDAAAMGALNVPLVVPVLRQCIQAYVERKDCPFSRPVLTKLVAHVPKFMLLASDALIKGVTKGRTLYERCQCLTILQALAQKARRPAEHLSLASLASDYGEAVQALLQWLVSSHGKPARVVRGTVKPKKGGKQGGKQGGKGGGATGPLFTVPAKRYGEVLRSMKEVAAVLALQGVRVRNTWPATALSKALMRMLQTYDNLAASKPLVASSQRLVTGPLGETWEAPVVAVKQGGSGGQKRTKKGAQKGAKRGEKRSRGGDGDDAEDDSGTGESREGDGDGDGDDDDDSKGEGDDDGEDGEASKRLRKKQLKRSVLAAKQQRRRTQKQRRQVKLAEAAERVTGGGKKRQPKKKANPQATKQSLKRSRARAAAAKKAEGKEGTKAKKPHHGNGLKTEVPSTPTAATGSQAAAKKKSKKKKRKVEKET